MHANSTNTSNAVMKNTAGYSLTGTAITWTNDTANNCSYNIAYNLYIYHVANVEAARIANGDPDYMGRI